MGRGGGEEGVVWGNKQLLSVFFIVVVLLGVFFTMGYIIGRNTATVTTASAKSDVRPVPKNDNPPDTAQSKPAVPDVPPAPSPTSPQPAKSYEEPSTPAPPGPVHISGQLSLQAFASRLPA